MYQLGCSRGHGGHQGWGVDRIHAENGAGRVRPCKGAWILFRKQTSEHVVQVADTNALRTKLGPQKSLVTL